MHILYRRINEGKSIGSKEAQKLLQLPIFREEIAYGLISSKRSVGRPSLQNLQPETITIGKKAKHPSEELRYDGYDHFPIWLSKEDGGKRKCKFCKTSETQCFCKKCKLNLCCSNSKNCFYEYHNKN